jgi:hypothetical protein
VFIVGSLLKTKTSWIAVAVVVLLVAIIAQLPVGDADLRDVSGSVTKVSAMDFSAFSSAPPDRPLDLLFIHHSVGTQWLADPGPEGNNSHPEGGALRKYLEQQGYIVHEATYGSAIGEQTDLFDWLPKFRDHMAQILACANQNDSLTPPAQYRIVLFKSCYPNSAFIGLGDPPGNPAGPELTLANAQSTYHALLGEFQKHPDVLFVCVTTPPLAPRLKPEPLWKSAARVILNKGDRQAKLLRSAALARQFANWLKADDGWLKDYTPHNAVVFDYYDILTGRNGSDLLNFPTNNGLDSHPSAAGQRLATEAFIPFINQAARRAGLCP